MEKPMLAHSWDKYSHKIEYPCYVQPKLDGMRCLAVREGNTIRYYSRALKEVKTVHHLDAHLLEVMKDGDIWDGELYTHNIPFQRLISLIKREQEGTRFVEYHVYDRQAAGTYDEREQSLYAFRKVETVPTYVVHNEEELEKLHNDFVATGYEGTMIRNIKSEYKAGKRSFDLLKKKDWFDEEYPIVNVVEGKGKFEGCAVFICRTDKGKDFAVTSPGKIEQKKEYFIGSEALIGLQATVKYQEKTNAGIPRFPICVGVRDYE